jgi:probable phosphoglycerate mutase
MAATATRVFIVRHGATVVSAEDRFAGATDVELSDEGREQTRRLAERLSDEKIIAVYASPLGRTVETAQILAAPHKLEVQTRDGFSGNFARSLGADDAARSGTKISRRGRRMGK